MGARGAIPLPTIVQIQRGDPGHRARKQFKTEPKPDSFKSCPKPPEGMGDDVKEVWNHFARNLWELGLLTKADYNAFCDFCVLRAQLDWLIKTLGEGKMKAIIKSGEINPVLEVALTLRKTIKDLEMMFGLNPSARARMRIESGEGKTKAEKGINRILGYD